MDLSDSLSLKDLPKRHFIINRALNSLDKELSNEFTSIDNKQGTYSFI